MAEIHLPPPGPHMLDKLEHPARNKILRMGRRWRKTTLGLIAGICGHGPDRSRLGVVQGANIWFVDKSFKDASSVWAGVKEILLPDAVEVSELDRRIEISTGGAITIKSAVSPDSLTGDWRGIDGVILNEAAQWKEEAWELLRPALSDKHAWTIWPSTPRGFNYWKRIVDNAAAASEMSSEWAKWHEPSFANPFWDPKEIDKSRADGMSEMKIQQEYFAEFVLWGAGRTYPEFDRDTHIRPSDYDHTLPIDLCINFRVAPAAWLVTQGSGPQTERAIAEITVDGGAGTVRDYIEEFRKLYPEHARGERVRVFGDASPGPGAKSTSLSDYELVRQALPRASGNFFVRRVAAPEKDRINCVNNVQRDLAGAPGGFIDPSCTRLIRDLEGTLNNEASFQVDRQTDLGHYAHAWSCKFLWLYPVLAHRAPKSVASTNPWPKSTPAARRAQGAVYRAKKSGRLQEPKKCPSCSGPGPFEFAHTNYEGDGLNGRFLCRPCHVAEDLRSPKGGTVARH